MLAGLRTHASTVVVAMVTAAVTAAAPALAAAVVNADKLDGRNGVSCDAPGTKRANVYVATCANGKLPNNIIKKASNANKLDDLDSSAFLRSNGTALDSDKLDGKDSTDFLGDTEQAANAALLDGRDSSDFDDAELLDGQDSTDFLQNSGAMRFTAGAWDWRVDTPSVRTTAVAEPFGGTTRVSNGGQTTSVPFALMPDFPAQLYGSDVLITSAELCYNFTGGAVIDEVRFQALNAGVGAGHFVGAEAVDTTDRTDNQCQTYTLDAPRDATATLFKILVTVKFPAAGSLGLLGRVTLVGEPSGS